jgi:excinuclease ABC subunit C
LADASENLADLAKDDSNLNDDFLDEIYKQTLLEAFPAELPVGASKIFVYRDFEDAALVAQILSERHGVKFEIVAPKIGEKRKICDLARENALALIDKHLRTHNYEFLRGLQEYFSLTHLPLKIECFDNSHLFGAAPVGGMIAWDTDKFAKSGYRHMHLSSANDYDQMREMLISRAQRFDKLAPPDLWVLDGGDALLRLASEIAASSGANIDIIAISKEKIDAKAHRAKGRANDNIYTLSGKFVLPPSDPKLQFFQRLRDEAHRFAITFHQKTRRKEDLASGELSAAGVSAGSIAKLIKYFGTFEAIKEASAEEIAKVTNKSVAEKIFALISQTS